MIEIKNVSKIYSKSNFKAVDGISFEVKAGEIFGFIGPNGAGKTTTIKMMTGILPITSGSIHVCDYNIESESVEAKLNMGYVSDSHIVYDKLTGYEYINFIADVFLVSSEKREERANKLLELFDLKAAASSQIKTYSHGMRQKISIIGALIHEPKIWILDEPMTGLDPRSAFELKGLMREHAAKGNMVFFSTHILEVAEKLCDRIAIINKGRIACIGTMKEIKGRMGDKSLEDIFIEVAR